MVSADGSTGSVAPQPSGVASRRLVALVPLLVGLVYFVGLAPYGLHVGEDGDILYEAFATYRGQLPYIDYSTGYTPGYFFWHAALFHVFGVDALVLRIASAIANAATMWLLYLLAARVVRPTFALLPPLVFVAALPVYPGEFASFNVAYPAWYNIAFFLASLLAIDTYAHTGRVRAVFCAGLLAGLSFSFKPNVGLFNIAALSIFVAWWHAPRPDTSRFERAAWWAVAIATLGGVLAVFGVNVLDRKFALFPLPFLTAAGILVVNARRGVGRPGFLWAALPLFVGFALPNVTWIAYFLGKLGLHGFLHDVLLIGSSYEPFFTIDYRRLFSMWDAGIVVVVATFALVPLAIRRRWLAPSAPFVAALAALVVGGAYVLLFAPMRYGFHAAVVTRVQDLAFFILPMINWGGIALLAVRVSAAPAERSPQLGLLVLLTLAAPALALGMHPRADFMHLLISAPVTMIVAVILLDRVLRHWCDVLPAQAGWRWATALTLAAPIVVVAAVLVWPGASLAARLYTHYTGLNPVPLAHLDLPRASFVREAGDDRDFTLLHSVASYVGANTDADDYVFPFPNLSLLCFLTGRLNPTAKGYFIAGYPDHATEALIVGGMRERMPRMVIMLEEHQVFVLTAPAYYFLIREFVERNFERAARIGPYLALVRRGSTSRAAGDTPELLGAAADNWDGLDDPDPMVQLATAKEIDRRRDPGGAVALARRSVSRSAVNRLYFLRIASQFADERAVPALVQIAARDFTTAYGQLAANALYYIAQKSMTEHFWIAPDNQRRRLREVRAELSVEPLRTWLRSRRIDGRLRYVASWASGVLEDETATPHLVKILQGEDSATATMAGFALVQLGKTQEAAEDLVAAVDVDDIYAPSILIELYKRDPTTARTAIAAGLQTGNAKARENLSWVIGALGDPVLVAAVADLRDDLDPQVRRAATWAVAKTDAPGRVAESRDPAVRAVISSGATAP